MKACIFDLDGTLLYTLESMEHAGSRVLKELGFSALPAENYRYYCGDGAEELVCAVDGPIVLAGLTDHDAGIRGDLSDPDSILLPQQSHTYGAFVWTQNVYLTRKQKENFRMVPLYEVTDEPYTVYFTRKA